MYVTTKHRKISQPQIDYILGLTKSRSYLHLDGEVAETIHDVLGNVGNPDPKFVSVTEASAAIKALLGCKEITKTGSLINKPAGASFKSIDTDILVQVLVTVPTSKYALERVGEPGVFDFFEVIERKSGRRYLNRLIGSPGDWRREFLSLTLQLAAARHIAENPTGAALAYCKHHGRCCRCDAKLSVDKSIIEGVGPVCRKKMGW